MLPKIPFQAPLHPRSPSTAQGPEPVQITTAIIQQGKWVTLAPPQPVVSLEVHLRQLITLFPRKPQLRFLHLRRHHSTAAFQDPLRRRRRYSHPTSRQHFGYLWSTPSRLITQRQHRGCHCLSRPRWG